jgi:hypothetical protein
MRSPRRGPRSRFRSAEKGCAGGALSRDRLFVARRHGSSVAAPSGVSPFTVGCSPSARRKGASRAERDRSEAETLAPGATVTGR